MAATLDAFFAEALNLSDEIRLQLVERLIPTIHGEPSLEGEQIKEVRRRVEEVRSGLAKTLPGEDVFREIQESLESRRSA